jgi:hypothetical protein
MLRELRSLTGRLAMEKALVKGRDAVLGTHTVS